MINKPSMKSLSKKVLKYLKQNENELLSDYQRKYKSFLIENDFGNDPAFLEFMSAYSGEMHGSEGYLSDVVDDLIDYTESSFNYQMHTNDNVPENYISLTDDITEVYLLYNKLDGEVVLIEGANAKRLLSNDFDRRWKSFNDFLEDFFELN